MNLNLTTLKYQVMQDVKREHRGIGGEWSEKQGLLRWCGGRGGEWGRIKRNNNFAKHQTLRQGEEKSVCACRQRDKRRM